MRKCLVLLAIIVLVAASVGCAEEERLPTVTSVNPNQGDQGETLDITITGTNFTGATEVSFGAGTTVNSFAVDSSTRITANITVADDATTGARDVSVTTPEGTGTLADGFGVGEAPPRKPEGTLTVAVTTIGRGTFLPWPTTARETLRYASAMADYLTYVKHDTLEVIPGLAERWEISDDNKSVTFFLREGVQFHDGWGELTSADVKYSFDTYMAKVITGAVVTWRPMIERTEAPGPYEFTIYFNQPVAAYAPSMVSSAKGCWIPITCKEYVEAVGEQQACLDPIFTGPYKFDEIRLGDYVKLEAVEDHWRVVPEFKYLVFKEVPEPMTRAAMMRTGEADLAEVPINIGMALGEAGFTKVLIPDAFYLDFWLLGHWLPDNPNYDPNLPWLDTNVRKAMNLAINRQEIADYIFYGYGKPSGTISYFPWESKYEPYPYDPDEAIRLLEQAGYADGFDVEIWLVSYSGQASEIQEVTEAIAGYWENIGLHTKIVPYSIASIWGRVMQRQTTGVVFGVAQWVLFEPWDQQLTKSFYSTAALNPYFDDPSLDVLFEQIMAGPSSEERDAITEQITDILYEEYAFAPIVKADMMWVKNSEVVGEWPVVRTSLNFVNFEYITHSPPLDTFRLFEP